MELVLGFGQSLPFQCTNVLTLVTNCFLYLADLFADLFGSPCRVQSVLQMIAFLVDHEAPPVTAVDLPYRLL